MKNKEFFFIFLIIIFNSCRKIKTDYFLPKNYKGDVAVIYGYKNGIEPHLKNDRFQIEIPDSGIVFLKLPFEEGYVDERFFEKKDNGSYDTIPIFSPLNPIVPGKTYIYFIRVTTFDVTRKRDKSIVSRNAGMFYVGERLDTTSGKKDSFLKIILVILSKMRNEYSWQSKKDI